LVPEYFLGLFDKALVSGCGVDAISGLHWYLDVWSYYNGERNEHEAFLCTQLPSPRFSGQRRRIFPELSLSRPGIVLM